MAYKNLTPDQKATASAFFSKNPEIDVLYMNPQGEFFTIDSLAHNSLPKEKDGKRIGKIEEIVRRKNQKDG